MAAFFEKVNLLLSLANVKQYAEAANSTMGFAELRTLATIAPNVRVVYIRVRVISNQMMKK